MSSEKKRTNELRGRIPQHSGDDAPEDRLPLVAGSIGATEVAVVDDQDHKMCKSLWWRNGGKLDFQAVWRDIRLRWRFMSVYSRVVCLVILLWLLQYLVFGILDMCFARPQKWPVRTLETKFAVVINTYKRPDMLQQAVQHYAQTCGPRIGVTQVFVIWAELDVTPPSPQTWLQQGGHTRRGKEPKTSMVKIIRVAKDSLNSRFLPIEGLDSSAIFMVDDDVRVDCASLKQGFDAWRTNPNAMVGYYPRLALESSSGNGDHIYQAWPGVYWRQAANFMLTKASFLHHRYMVMYSDPAIHPVEILEYVDKYKNCEDVAMSLLVANATATSVTESAPNIIYVEGHISDKGLTGGISSSGKSQHFSHRSDCLRDMSAMYAAKAWRPPLSHVRLSLRAITWIRHVPGFGWQIRPSNFFEWFAFTNMFKS